MTNALATLARHPGLDPGSTPQRVATSRAEGWTLKQVQGDGTSVAVEAQKLPGISLEGSVG
jgi:hypothetical protein